MKIISGHEKGFTLVEVLVALAILGSITGVMAMTVSQTITGSGRSNDQATVLNQIQNAGYWIVRDAQMSQNDKVGAFEDHPHKVVSFKWWDWSDGTKKLRRADYTLEDNKLIRTFRRHEGKEEESPNIKTETVVAMYIEQAGSTYDGKLLTVSITARFGEASLTKEYQVKPRETGMGNPWE